MLDAGWFGVRRIKLDHPTVKFAQDIAPYLPHATHFSPATNTPMHHATPSTGSPLLCSPAPRAGQHPQLGTPTAGVADRLGAIASRVSVLIGPGVSMLVGSLVFISFGFAQEASSVSNREVAALIEALGDDSYIVRSRAREQLQQLGLEAFDELQAAQFHPDSEILSAARYLINSVQVSWSKESDPAEVREALFEYGAQDTDERGSRIRRIASLPDRQGLAALARLTRFESDLALSRQAALALIKQPMKPSKTQCQHDSQRITEILKDSQRQAVQWLRVYANDLKNQGYSVDQWRALIKKQRREIDAGTSDTSNRDSVLELVRTCAGRAVKLNHRDEALKLAAEHMDLISPTTRNLIDACNWATDIQLHEFVLRLQKKNARMFSDDPRLLYAAAEAQRSGGNVEKAQQWAKEALAMNPFPKKDSDDDSDDDANDDQLSDSDVEDIAKAHIELANALSQRGLYDWAENEYRLVMGTVPVTSLSGANARRKLGLMLGELLRHRKAIVVYKPLIDRLRKDSRMVSKLIQNRISTRYLESQFEYHQAMVAKEDNDLAASRRLLKHSLDLLPENMDVLIEMYRTEGDEEWKTLVKRLINSQTRRIRGTIAQQENQLRIFPQRPDLMDDLALSLNDYAWLVSNTTGDYEDALKASKRSLKLTPDDAAKIDTCARCYMTLGRLDEALEMQSQAAKLEPHSPPMARQLQQIKDLIAKKNAKDD